MLPFLSFFIPNTIKSIMCLCYSILFFFLVLLFTIPIVRCSASDCLEDVIDGNNTLVSPGGAFELGFFTPDGNNDNERYLGIWYFNHSNPKVVVWVANRDKPLLESSGSLVIENHKAMVLDAKGLVYWSTDDVLLGQVQTPEPANSAPTFNGSNRTSPHEFLRRSYDISFNRLHPPTPPPPPPHHGDKRYNSTRNTTRLCLKDNGNLVLDDNKEQRNPVLWQSFAHPTDTFLPGMSLDGSLFPTSNLTLTSWQSPNKPEKGNFTFMLQAGTANNWVIVQSRHSHYWESRTNPFDKNASALSGILFEHGDPLLPGSMQRPLTRLVMNFTGQIQFWNWESERGWSLKWSEPMDGCSLSNMCGQFGSCNSNNAVLCKCLPGFKPSELWKSGDTSGGCIPMSASPNNRNDSSSDIFLPLPMMTVGNGSCTVSNEGNCTAGCLGDSTCVAYSLGLDCSGAGTSTEKRCLLWKNVLDDLQEESPNGITIYVRTTHSDIESISRACKPCGTYIIPYPLSTAAYCGDTSYLNFICNATTGQVYFSTGNHTYRVTSFDPDAKKFTIQVGHGKSCGDTYSDSIVLSPKDSFAYKSLKCKVVKGPSFLEVGQSFIEVEMGWKPPSEPTCNASSDCHDWPHTSCKTRGGKRSCFCGSRFYWDGKNLKCSKVTSLKVVIPGIAGGLTIILLCGIFFIYRTWKKRPDELKGTDEFETDDTEGIDVPFFDWETTLAATNNFSNINKLGTGGFGSVYRGKLPDGQEIAVKRLSSVSVQGLEEFRTEVKLIAKLQHRNLVRLIGYCMKTDEKILVYEYMPNGSLDSCLFDEKHSVYLDWKTRSDIILGIARGLLYLHQDSRLRIIHRDLKPSNILLDEELNPKISDFGIARIVGGKETEASTKRVVGTYGYMSPEYASDGIFSVKSDVFSFGVVILETISGRRNSKIFMYEHGLSLLGHAWKLCDEDKGLELMDPKLNESCCLPEFLKCIHIGLLCVQEDPSDRPTMSTVVHMLSGEYASLPLAKQPAFMNRKPLSENASSSSAMDSSVHEVMTVPTVGR